MIQQLLLNSTPPIRWQMNVETGQQLSAPSPLLLDWIVNGNTRESKSLEAVIWRLPDEREVNADSIITELPGTYSIDGLTEATVYLSAQAPLDESNLEAESEDGLKSLADRLGATIMGSSDDLAKLEPQGSRELWRWFLIGLLALLFGELLLQRRLSGVSA